MRRRGLRRAWQPQSGGILSSLISLLFVLLLCLILYFARRPLLRLVGEAWVIDDPVTHADAIIVISDDNFYADRAAQAADLYRHGVAPLVVASGRKLRPYAGIAELMEHDLVERGVPKDKILRFAHVAENTREEAHALLPLAIDHKWHSVVVVTSNFHTRRTRYIFTRVFPSTISVRVSSAKDGDFDPDTWWQKRVSFKELTREMAGMLVAIWELWGEKTGNSKTPSVVGLNGLKPQPVV
jgi:uncharacterized SAM-binding protein YcdF (DUF218 family)